MGMIAAIFSLVSVILVATFSKLVADDVKAWQPRITRHLIKLAVRQLPEDQRERYMEEWTAFIDDTPGDLSKMLRATSLIWAARSMAASTSSVNFVTKMADGVRRTNDVLSCSLLLFLIAPGLLTFMVAIMLQGGGGTLVREQRVGRNGEIFYFLMLRTTSNTADGTKITFVGNFLRKTGLDHLPNLINILRGELSLVGPRPEPPDFAEKCSELVPAYRERHAVRPGHYGWQQVNQPDATSVADAKGNFLLDEYYLKNRSLRLDLRILFMAFKSIGRKKPRLY
jgi:lipopolysaccharide/colanic/teichoic acid biosynthesis glycosyltransferase